MNIELHNLVLVCKYGEDPAWYEVVAIDGDKITCDNGHRELFTVSRSDIHKVTNDTSVLQ